MFETYLLQLQFRINSARAVIPVSVTVLQSAPVLVPALVPVPVPAPACDGCLSFHVDQVLVPVLPLCSNDALNGSIVVYKEVGGRFSVFDQHPMLIFNPILI